MIPLWDRLEFQGGEETVNKPVESYIDGEIDGVVMRPLKVFNDSRGWLVELFRQDDVVEEWWPVMTYVSQTLPGVTRGPHEHVDQTDGFAFLGPSDFKLFLWDIRAGSATRGRRGRGAWCIKPGGGLDSAGGRACISQCRRCAGACFQRS